VTGLRILAFGELASELWGVSWAAGESGQMRLAARAGTAAAVREVALERVDDAWELTGEGVSLLFRPATPPIAGHDPEGQLERQDQLCEVTGGLAIDGQEIEIGCLGWAASLGGEAVEKKSDSVRFLAAWLDPQAGFSLTAVRPRKARGQEADAVAAVVVDEPPPRVVDPRLSTTYTEAGEPVRAGLELWLEPEEAEDSDDEAVQYPRRAMGEVAGPGLDWSQDNLELHASLLRWHSHGHEGPGVYVLGRRR
jgi:hypothetical protein